MGLAVSRTHAATPTPAKSKRSDMDSDSEDTLFDAFDKKGKDQLEATWLLDQKDQKEDVEGEEEKPKYPKSVIFIMGNEFCERFSYYGMRAVLTLYLTQVLQFSDSLATVVYHSFTMLCYFTPLFGAILSDTKLGKFRTIFYLSILYAIGNIVLSSATIPTWNMPHLVFSMIGLVLIGIGTGGIKPCVAAFGGDQFADSQEKERQQFFSIFYFSINAGSLISTFVTPILRADVKCFEGQENCFALAFGLPAILMIVAVLFFVAGKPLYKIVPPQGNVLLDVVKCVSHALSNKFHSHEKREHFVDYADDKYDKKLIEDVKAVLRVLFMYLPLPVFWALFDQQGSRWTLQATRMDGHISFLNYTIKPDQIQVINPMMILIMIPIFETILYPLFEKCHLLTRPLQRISVGGILAGVSFVVAGFLQIAVEDTLPVPPAPGHSDLSLLNMMPNCFLNVTVVESGDYVVPPFTNYSIQGLEANSRMVEANFWGEPGCQASGNFNVELEEKNVTSLAIGIAPGGSGSVLFNTSQETRSKAKNGLSDIRLVYNINPNFLLQNSTILIVPADPEEKTKNFTLTDPDGFNSTEYQLVNPAKYTLYLPHPKNPNEHLNESFMTIELRQGAAYTLLLYIDDDQKVNATLITDVAPNTLSMFLQVPQYLIITLGEVMFSITGLEFSYSQAPASMKSVLQAAWLLTVAFGNLIVVIVAEAEFFEKQSYEFFLFAGLMIVDMAIFIVMSLFYVYVKSPNEEAEEDVDEMTDAKTIKEKEAGLTNQGFQDDTKF